MSLGACVGSHSPNSNWTNSLNRTHALAAESIAGRALIRAAGVRDANEFSSAVRLCAESTNLYVFLFVICRSLCFERCSRGIHTCTYMHSRTHTRCAATERRQNKRIVSKQQSRQRRW